MLIYTPILNNRFSHMTCVLLKRRVTSRQSSLPACLSSSTSSILIMRGRSSHRASYAVSRGIDLGLILNSEASVLLAFQWYTHFTLALLRISLILTLSIRGVLLQCRAIHLLLTLS